VRMIWCAKCGDWVEERHEVEGNVEALVCPSCGSRLGEIRYG